MGGNYTMDIEEIASKIVAAAIKVHTALGPGWNVPRMKDGIKRMVNNL